MRRSVVPSETGSEHSQNSARQSTEIRVCILTPLRSYFFFFCPRNLHLMKKKICTVHLLNIFLKQIPTTLTLAAPPEKGILKKQGARSTEALPLKTFASGSGEPSYCAISDSPYVASLESEYMAIGDPPLRQQVRQ